MISIQDECLRLTTICTFPECVCVCIAPCNHLCQINKSRGKYVPNIQYLVMNTSPVLNQSSVQEICTLQELLEHQLMT